MDPFAFDGTTAQFNLSWCTAKKVLQVVLKYLVHGLLVAGFIRYVPVYGQLITDSEVLSIAVMIAIATFVLNKFVPDTFLSI